MAKTPGFFGKLRDRLGKTRSGFVAGVRGVFLRHTRIEEEVFEELEEILIQADLGVETTMELVEHLREATRERKLSDPNDLLEILKEEIEGILSAGDPSVHWEVPEGPHVTLIAGVNGSGKTTTIGKLAARLRDQGKSVMLGAADTFRAAAVEQLTVWSERVGVPIVKHQEGADPAAVAHDAVGAALARGVDCLIIDTAGRMHTKVNLMEELRKIQRVIAKQIPEAPHEVLLVLDATTGQNGLQQAKRFTEASSVTGIVLTKLDGTAKGGIAVAIQKQLGIPIKFIGVGEGIDDLQPFNAQEFITALFEE
ncbi:MAG: signal recognition particle-docking protein FtsY [Candidatus Hydrogenedentes bacterium]|nr:signal recognition particle-docking protein FtsY [Candidatus Hydrogenedentota bacterium]